MCYNTSMAKPVTHISLDLLFRALADPTRLRLLNLIADREICVCYFVGILGLPQPKVSRHLAYLRRGGLVLARREGKWMHYRLALPIERGAQGPHGKSGAKMSPGSGARSGRSHGKNDDAAAAILRETLKHLRSKPEMRRDIARLSSACCAPAKFEVLADAPQPSQVAAAYRP
jgi:ArsR family transcriptional regulator, arsenate/arsenite/antimonite-responsive transcriptional repressor